jgi:predicted DNA-binding ribbon-helix-helix protein
MSASKKPRADSVLKTLPEERQREIIERMRAPEMTLAMMCAELRKDGVETSTSALSRFWEFWHLREGFRADEQTVEQLIEQLKAEIPGLSDEQLDQMGQRTFSLLALRKQDLEGFVSIRTAANVGKIEAAKLRLRERAEARMVEKLSLERDKFQFSASEACLKHLPALREIAADNSLDQNAKIDAIRNKLFGVVAE